MARGILALDQGTTSSRAIVFGQNGAVLAMAQREITQHYPQPGWVEHDPEEIWQSQLEVAREAIVRSGVTVEAVGITNQRETTVVWDRRSGAPVYPAIVWQDRRTAARCDSLPDAASIQAKTGLRPDSYFSATKIEWILDNVPGARARAENGELAFGTVDSFLIWRLTEGRIHVTDVSNASRTMLFDIGRLCWDEELLATFRIPASMLPTVVPSSGIVAVESILGAPLCGIAGDQQAATFGQACLHPGIAKCTYGTGCFLLAPSGVEVPRASGGLLATVAWQLGSQTVEYAIEGSVFVGGAAIQWLRDELGIISASKECEGIASSVADSGGVVMVPAFSGLGAPHWDSNARGTIVGLTRGTTSAHLMRAALESIAFQVYDLAEAMDRPLTNLRVDGGASQNDFLMQFQADLLGIPVLRPENTESTAQGAAYLAGLGCGFWSSAAQVEALWNMGRCFEPSMDESVRKQKLGEWNRAVECALRWARPG
jgi:glycerol kinase